MASSIKKMRDEVTCHICLKLMTEPVTISCGHNFCHQCIEGIPDNQQLFPELYCCVLCGDIFRKTSLRFNKQLKNLIEAIKEMEHEMLCEEHREPLQLFCKNEGQLICWCCERSPQHQGHKTAPVEEVCPGYKEKLQEIVTKLKKDKDLCESAKLFMGKQIMEWEENIELQREKIQSEFKKLYNFIHEEEKRYLWRLENEKDQVLRRLQENEASLEKQSLEFERHIQELKEFCHGSAQNLLQNVEDMKERFSDVKPEIPETFSLQPQIVCNVSELYFDVKKMLKQYQVSVTLDPETAHPELIVSEDQKHVKLRDPCETCETQNDCFSPRICVLGCENFTSGCYYFEVDVREASGWETGVCLKNVQKDSDMSTEPQSGFWAIRSCLWNGLMAHSSPPEGLDETDELQFVGVFLDCDAGLVSFYNVATGSHIFTFPKASFSDTLQPYFQIDDYGELFLPPP